MTNKKNYKELEREKARGRLRYLERKQEEKEAEEEIRSFDKLEEKNIPVNDEDMYKV